MNRREDQRNYATVAEKLMTQKLEMKGVKIDIQGLKRYTRLIEREKKKVTLIPPEETRIKNPEVNKCIQNKEYKIKENWNCTRTRSGDIVLYIGGGGTMEVKFANEELAVTRNIEFRNKRMDTFPNLFWKENYQGKNRKSTTRNKSGKVGTSGFSRYQGKR